jgi:vesicle coat complex subunit
MQKVRATTQQFLHILPECMIVVLKIFASQGLKIQNKIGIDSVLKVPTSGINYY